MTYAIHWCCHYACPILPLRGPAKSLISISPLLSGESILPVIKKQTKVSISVGALSLIPSRTALDDCLSRLRQIHNTPITQIVRSSRLITCIRPAPDTSSHSLLGSPSNLAQECHPGIVQTTSVTANQPAAHNDIISEDVQVI